MIGRRNADGIDAEKEQAESTERRPSFTAFFATDRGGRLRVSPRRYAALHIRTPLSVDRSLLNVCILLIRYLLSVDLLYSI